MKLPPDSLLMPSPANAPSRPAILGALLGHFGSLRTALVLMALLGVAVLVGRFHTHWLATLLTAALALLSACLLVALVVTPALRRQAPLLVFHLALLGVVSAAGIGRMTALEGRFELLEGVDWDGQLLDGAVGAWHPVERLGRLSFRQDGFEIAYAPGLKRGPTQNLVRWRDAEGQPQSARIGDHRPLQLDGYRIYTSPNKGYAPLLRWEPRDGGEAVLGAVHLPSYPANALRQSQEWTLPDGQRLWLKLDFDPLLIDPEQSSRFRLPESHSLVLWHERERAELAPGEAFELPGGRLVYLGLRSWMGYRIAYDAALPWLLGLSLLAVASLAWHYTRRFFAPGRVAPVAPRAEVSSG